MERKMNSRNRSSGFTLVELLVVVSIIALLISILLPSLQKARDGAKRTMCQANLRSLGLGFHIYADAYNGIFPASYSLYDAPWGAEGDMYWHQRLIEEGLALGKNTGPKKNNAVCPSDKKPWTPYVSDAREEMLYNCSYGANPIAMIVDGERPRQNDGIHDWSGYLYAGRTFARRDNLRWAAYLILLTEVEGTAVGDSSPYYFEPWQPNKVEPNTNGDWAWGRHDRKFDGKQGGFLNMLHADGSVAHSRINQSIIGESWLEHDNDVSKKKQADRQFLPNPE